MACARTRPATARSQPLPHRQLIAQRAHGEAAMTEPILFGRVQLRSSPPQLRQPKVRIVAETSATSGGVDNRPLPNTFGNQPCRVRRRSYEDQRTSIARPPRLGAHAREGTQKLCVVRRVVGTHSGIASRKNTGGAAKAIDFEPGVVG